MEPGTPAASVSINSPSTTPTYASKVSQECCWQGSSFANSAIDAKYRHGLGVMRDTGKRAYEIRGGDNEIRIVSQTPTVFTARVDEHIVTQLIVDSSGKVTSHRHMLEPITTYQYVVVRIGDRWYLASVSEVDTDVHL